MLQACSRMPLNPQMWILSSESLWTKMVSHSQSHHMGPKELRARTTVRACTTKELAMFSLAVTMMTLTKGAEGITCFCLGHCPGNELNGTCTAPPGAPCFSGFLFFLKIFISSLCFLQWVPCKGVQPTYLHWNPHIKLNTGCHIPAQQTHKNKKHKLSKEYWVRDDTIWIFTPFIVSNLHSRTNTYSSPFFSVTLKWSPIFSQLSRRFSILRPTYLYLNAPMAAYLLMSRCNWHKNKDKKFARIQVHVNDIPYIFRACSNHTSRWSHIDIYLQGLLP